MTDNSPLLRFQADSSLNNKIAVGDRFNRRVRIRREDSPSQEYMQAKIDLSHQADDVDWIPVDSERAMTKALAEQVGLNSNIRTRAYAKKDQKKVHNRSVNLQDYHGERDHLRASGKSNLSHIQGQGILRDSEDHERFQRADDQRSPQRARKSSPSPAATPNASIRLRLQARPIAPIVEKIRQSQALHRDSTITPT